MDNLNRDFIGRVIVLNYLKSHAASIQVFMGHRDNIYRRVMVELKLLSSQPSPLGKGKGRSTKKTWILNRETQVVSIYIPIILS